MPTARDWETRVAARIDRDELVELTRRAVRFPTVNPPGDEAPLAEMLAATLRREGVGAELVAHGPGRASLAARLRGSGERPALILTGHLDVVGAGDRPWRYDPFGGAVADGRIYGRGTCDMKGAVAAMLLAAAALRRADAPLAGDLVLAFTAGEEIDGLGAEALASSGLLRGADALLIGEPSDLDVYVAEKGNLTVSIETVGRTAHASMPELGVNAIYGMADLIAALERWRPTGAPHPLLGEPTLSVGVVRGGVKSNVVPDGCTVEVDLRTLPGQPQARILAELEELLADLRARRPGLEVRVSHTLGRSAVETPVDAPLVGDVVAAVADVVGRAPTPGGVMYATDASVLVPQLGVPMTICGPGRREMAHQTDEYVAIDALVQAAQVYALVALRRLTG
jgi:succinyl-diaminopimelate desuccinylase